MCANKLLALRERVGKANRDIFDVWFFLSNHWPVNRELIEARSGKPFDEFIRDCIEELEKKGERDILAGLGELVSEKQKSFIKTHLKKETLFLLELNKKVLEKEMKP